MAVDIKLLWSLGFPIWLLPMGSHEILSFAWTVATAFDFHLAHRPGGAYQRRGLNGTQIIILYSPRGLTISSRWVLAHESVNGTNNRAASRFAPSQWETTLQSNAVSHWQGANLDSALNNEFPYKPMMLWLRNTLYCGYAMWPLGCEMSMMPDQYMSIVYNQHCVGMIYVINTNRTCVFYQDMTYIRENFDRSRERNNSICERKSYHRL